MIALAAGSMMNSLVENSPVIYIGGQRARKHYRHRKPDRALRRRLAEQMPALQRLVAAMTPPKKAPAKTNSSARKRQVSAPPAQAVAEIVATLWRQLSWSHFRELLPLKRPLQREFYAEMCRIEGWSVRALSERIDSMLYERTALSKNLKH